MAVDASLASFKILRMSQFEKFALKSAEPNDSPIEAPQGVRETFEVREQSAEKLSGRSAEQVADEQGEEVSDASDLEEEEEEEEASDDVTSEDESIEVIDDVASDDDSKENLHKSRNMPPRPSRSAKNKTFNYRVDEEDINVDTDAELKRMQNVDELEDSEDDQQGVRGGVYVDSSSEDEGPSKEDMLIIKEAKTGLKNVESILWQRRSPEADGVKEMRVKFVGTSYRRTQWVDREDLMAVGKQAMVRGYDRRLAQGKVDPYNDMVDGIHPDWCVVERVLGEREGPVDGEQQYLVKWCDLGYSESTWESADNLVSEEDLEAVAQYKARKALEAKKAKQKPAVDMPAMDMSSLPSFCNGRALRDYQKESLKWMAKNWYDGKNCILGDEMGLGKTAQSIACLEFQRQFGKVQDPFLIIAPLTTLGHWKREIQTWTDMNCVVYCGNAKDKAVINEYELYCEGSRVIKPDVILSSFEHVMKDAEMFQGIDWETMVIDEAHRMKGTKSATRTTIAGIPCQWILLLTGTPVQNNIKELFGILNLLDDVTFADEDEFLDRYGRSADKMTPEQVVALQQQLKPLLLRRMKEDVETLPEKEECVIWVELTKEQRAYYKAIFANQIGTLLGGASTENAPMLRNVAMELRKVCNHPFLCEGVEEDYAKRMKEAAAQAASADGNGAAPSNGIPSELDLLVSACGKMQLLHKLLPKLREEKRKVLIFSQFKMMLDVLEDYAHNMSYPVERIDGSTASKERQAAIDRFSNDEKDGFIFLLSTKAGGQGITLTAADTCILYDSDWNPQNDLQAMARCHRIGQSKDVTIYRLVSKNTYEENLFRTSSKKYGLDEAILGGLGSLGVVPEGGGNPEYDGARIAALLKHGAHCLKDEDKANEETDAFLSEDIEQILKGRTEKRQIGGRAGNTFSVATFGEQAPTPGKGEKNDEDFWKSLLPDAVASHEKAKEMATQPNVLPPRRRTTVNYNEKRPKRRSSDDDFVLETEDDTHGLGNPTKKSRSKKSKEPPRPFVKKWTLTDINKVLDGLLRFGMDLDRFESSSKLMEFFTQKKFEAPHVLEAARIVKGIWESLGPVVPDKPPSTTYSHEEGASEEFLQRKDQEIRDKRAKYQVQVTELMGNMIASLPTRLASLVTLGVPNECIECFSDPKFFQRIIEHAAAMTDHLDAMEAIRQRLIEKDAKLPKVDYKGTPEFWNKQLIYNNDDSNDRYILKRIYELGWEFSQRRSKDQDDTLMTIVKSDNFFDQMRTEFLGSSISPPTTNSYITSEQWLEAPDFGYKQLLTIVYRRVKAYMHELTRLLRLQRDLLKSRDGPGLAVAGPVEGRSAAQPHGVPKLQTAINTMLTPKISPTAEHGGEMSALNGVVSGSKLAFSGPPPSGKVGHTSAPSLKHASKQTDLFAAFKVPKPPARDTSDAVDIDMTKSDDLVDLT